MLDNYFIIEKPPVGNIKALRESKVRNLGVIGLPKIVVGDILVAIFRKQSIVYRFEGICIAIRKKRQIKPDVSIILRNVLQGIGIEFLLSYYYNRIYNLKILDYKRKNFFYRRAKLYYLRQKLNQASRIK